MGLRSTFNGTTCSCSPSKPIRRSSRALALSYPTCYAHALSALHTHANGLQPIWISATSSSTGVPPAAVLPAPAAGLSSSGLPATAPPGLSSSAATPGLPPSGTGLSSQQQPPQAYPGYPPQPGA